MCWGKAQSQVPSTSKSSDSDIVLPQNESDRKPVLTKLTKSGVIIDSNYVVETKHVGWTRAVYFI